MLNALAENILGENVLREMDIPLGAWDTPQTRNMLLIMSKC
jgi:hypothetical protein